MSDFDSAFFTRMRDYLADECDWFGMHEDNTVECMKAAFEAAQNPPKPHEPTGLGAVVVDADGLRWTRSTDSPKASYPWSPSQVGQPSAFAQIAAVRVLSEGVQP